MSFYAQNFVYDGTPGEQYGLRISSKNPESSSSASSDVQLITDTIYRRPAPFLYGIQQTPVLSFDIELNSEQKIDAVLATRAAEKFFGKTDYKKLQIMQPDMDMFYYNCVLANPKIKRVGGEIVGWDATVVCDAPWGWEFPKSITKNYSTGLASDSIVYNNLSDNNFYDFPQVAFTIDTFGGSLSLINNTDLGREFLFTGLSAGEVITVNNDLGIITSSLDLNRYADFNKNFFRVVQGRNDIDILGDISQLVITAKNARKIGG